MMSAATSVAVTMIMPVLNSMIPEDRLAVIHKLVGDFASDHRLITLEYLDSMANEVASMRLTIGALEDQVRDQQNTMNRSRAEKDRRIQSAVEARCTDRSTLLQVLRKLHEIEALLLAEEECSLASSAAEEDTERRQVSSGPPDDPMSGTASQPAASTAPLTEAYVAAWNTFQSRFMEPLAVMHGLWWSPLSGLFDPGTIEQIQSRLRTHPPTSTHPLNSEDPAPAPAPAPSSSPPVVDHSQHGNPNATSSTTNADMNQIKLSLAKRFGPNKPENAKIPRGMEIIGNRLPGGPTPVLPIEAHFTTGAQHVYTASIVHLFLTALRTIHHDDMALPDGTTISGMRDETIPQNPGSIAQILDIPIRAAGTECNIVSLVEDPTVIADYTSHSPFLSLLGSGPATTDDTTATATASSSSPMTERPIMVSFVMGMLKLDGRWSSFVICTLKQVVSIIDSPTGQPKELELMRKDMNEVGLRIAKSYLISLGRTFVLGDWQVRYEPLYTLQQNEPGSGPLSLHVIDVFSMFGRFAPTTYADNLPPFGFADACLEAKRLGDVQWRALLTMFDVHDRIWELQSSGEIGLLQNVRRIPI